MPLRVHGAGDVFEDDVADGDAVGGLAGRAGVLVVLADGYAEFGGVVEGDVAE